MLGSSVQSSKDMSTELLIVLGSSDKQWSVLEKVTIRNQQNGLVSFELTEMFDRFATECFLLLKVKKNVHLQITDQNI